MRQGHSAALLLPAPWRGGAMSRLLVAGVGVAVAAVMAKRAGRRPCEGGGAGGGCSPTQPRRAARSRRRLPNALANPARPRPCVASSSNLQTTSAPPPATGLSLDQAAAIAENAAVRACRVRGVGVWGGCARRPPAQAPAITLTQHITKRIDEKAARLRLEVCGKLLLCFAATTAGVLRLGGWEVVEGVAWDGWGRREQG